MTTTTLPQIITCIQKQKLKAKDEIIDFLLLYGLVAESTWDTASSDNIFFIKIYTTGQQKDRQACDYILTIKNDEVTGEYLDWK